MYDEECSINVNDEFKRNFQNVHPFLPWYKHDLEFSNDKFQNDGKIIFECKHLQKVLSISAIIPTFWASDL